MARHLPAKWNYTQAVHDEHYARFRGEVEKYYKTTSCNPCPRPFDLVTVAVGVHIKQQVQSLRYEQKVALIFEEDERTQVDHWSKLRSPTEFVALIDWSVIKLINEPQHAKQLGFLVKDVMARDTMPHFIRMDSEGRNVRPHLTFVDRARALSSMPQLFEKMLRVYLEEYRTCFHNIAVRHAMRSLSKIPLSDRLVYVFPGKVRTRYISYELVYEHESASSVFCCDLRVLLEKYVGKSGAQWIVLEYFLFPFLREKKGKKRKDNGQTPLHCPVHDLL